MPELLGRVLSWASEIDDNTLEQAQRTASLPFVEGHLALMPDAHFGSGATIGTVIPTRGAVIPAAVGVDIGCGMIAVETNLTSGALPDTLGPLHGRIREHVPAGMGKGHTDPRAGAFRHWPSSRPSTATLAADTGAGCAVACPDNPPNYRLFQKARAQFGSLGGGNHFIEVCIDETDHVWVVLHSGSRGVGKELADRHIDTAKGLMADWFIELPDPDLAYLVEGTQAFDDYIADMLWAQEYAAGNRETMMDAVLDQLWLSIGGYADDTDGPSRIEVSRINCHHNYTVRENHHGRNVWLTRKGAIRAREGDLGIIPGSMATGSFIVRGLGNPASYQSCAHGAGRRMSRGRARRELDVDGLVTAMDGKTWNDRDAQALLDEDPRAYKPIDTVMADQADLVTVEHTLHQVLNYKGVEAARRKRRRS